MRTMEFKMERPGLVQIGDAVEIEEREGTGNYSYIIEPAVAMSGCYYGRDRLFATYGIVEDIIHNQRGYYVVVAFEDQEP